MNCFGALGSSSSWGRPLKFTIFSINCSFVGFFLNFTNTAAVWPFKTGTRMHWQVIFGSSAFTITPSLISPQRRKRLLFALLFLAADIGNDVLHHLRPVLKSLSRSGYGLIGRRHHLVRLKFLPGGQHRRIALNGAVRLDGDKSSAGSQTLFLDTESRRNAPD